MATPPESLIDFRNITVYRDEKVALDGLTLSISTGEHVALIGPNGCGKSTLIKAITRECYPAVGIPHSSLTILGRERWHVFDLRAAMGIVSADLMQACTRDFSAREVVLSGFFSSIGIWPNHEVTPAMVQRADAILDLLEIAHLAGRNVEEMSSGEARRVLIGRALVHNPAALLLDEPSTSLDLRAQKELSSLLRKIARGGKSLILVTHHLPDIVPEIERIVLLREGRVFRDGPKAEILTARNLSDLFGTPVQLAEHDGYFHIW